MIQLAEKIRSVDLPYNIRLYGVTEELFDDLVDEDTRAELIDGVMIVHSPASMRHDNLAGFLGGTARLVAESTDQGLVLGPDSMIHLATCRKFAPDVYFIYQNRVLVPLPKMFEGSPNMVMEVLSPSNRVEDLDDKRPAYQKARVDEIWIIDPENEEVEIDQLRKKRYVTKAYQTGRVESEVLKGFWIEVDWLWQDELPKVMPTVHEILGE